MYRKLQRLYARRKAISPVVATILLIALTVAAVAIIYFLIVPLFSTRKLQAEILMISDSDKDSLYDEIELQVSNSGTSGLNITSIVVWTATESDLGNSENWIQHTGWTFTNPDDSYISQSEVTEVTIQGEQQIGLTIYEDTYYQLEIIYSGAEQPFRTEWVKIVEGIIDISDIITNFDTFDLTANGFEGTIDDPSRAANNYVTTGGDYSLTMGTYMNLPVLNETDILFYITGKVVVFHSPNGNLSNQPLRQHLTLDAPLRAKKLFILGLAGSWGDEFPSNSWALRLMLNYTDGSTETYDLDHDYIDDWWYGANPGDDCISAPSGKVTEIDLGTQVDTPHSHIHTHTTRFYFDYYKYIDAITFVDPGTDNSGPHLLSITFR
ncbi:MAG: archaellin/type IV pilin N-terminal domain-containing protein [Asgard group archaeon]|nr:archaellin/type IV pilin N-terminal domain-containing protein [Asgard group archaeon]